MIKLQNLVFPKPGICYEQEMFFRPVSVSAEGHNIYQFDAQAQSLRVDRFGSVLFDTYFNSLSIGKWKKYTSVTTFSLELDIQGTFAVKLLHSKYINGAVIQKVIGERELHFSTRKHIDVPFPDCEAVGTISFRLDSLEDGGILYGGGYVVSSSESEATQVELALNICNFKREAYIYRNMENIRRYILENQDSPLRDHLHIFVADNSKTVELNRLPPECSQVFPQGDFGGAGGFTRGLMEILRAKDELALTHVVMMDDDILIEPESLERMFAFLRFLREKYRTAFLGGALLRLDFQNIQTSHGGEWDWERTYVFHKCNANLLSLRDVLINEIEDGAKLNAWWLHCMPLSELSLENLPYPFFFHMDDMEYDLRNCKQIIHVNGICVWHEPFEYKPGSHLCYYNARNILIAHMLHCVEMTAKDAVGFLNREFFHHLWVYRYREAELVLSGIEDALKGPDWLAAQQPEQLLEEVLAKGYKKQELDELPMRLDYCQYLSAFRGEEVEPKWRRCLRHLTLNGHFQNVNRDAVVPMYDPSAKAVYRAKRVLNYDPVSNRGFVTEKSCKELLKALRHYLKVRRLVKKQFRQVRENYQQKFHHMTCATFWNSYLGLTAKDEYV